MDSAMSAKLLFKSLSVCLQQQEGVVSLQQLLVKLVATKPNITDPTCTMNCVYVRNKQYLNFIYGM